MGPNNRFQMTGFKCGFSNSTCTATPYTEEDAAEKLKSVEEQAAEKAAAEKAAAEEREAELRRQLDELNAAKSAAEEDAAVKLAQAEQDAAAKAAEQDAAAKAGNFVHSLAAE